MYNDYLRYAIPIMKNVDNTYNRLPYKTTPVDDYHREFVFPEHSGDWHGFVPRTNQYLYPNSRISGHSPTACMSWKAVPYASGVNWTWEQLYASGDLEPTSTNNVSFSTYSFTDGPNYGKKIWMMAPKMRNFGDMPCLSARFRQDGTGKDDKWAYYSSYNDEYTIRINPQKVTNVEFTVDFYYLLRYECVSFGTHVASIFGAHPEFWYVNNDGNTDVVPQALNTEHPDTPLHETEVHTISKYDDPDKFHVTTHILVKCSRKVIGGDPSWISFPRLGLSRVYVPINEPMSLTISIEACGMMVKAPKIEDTNWNSYKLQPMF